MVRFKQFLFEAQSDTFSKEEIKSRLESMGYKDITVKGNKIIAKTDEKRVPLLKELANEFDGDFIASSSYSSVGATKVGSYAIILKPLTAVKGSGGKEFEYEFCDSLKKFNESDKTATNLPYQKEVETIFNIMGSVNVKEIYVSGGDNVKRKMSITDKNIKIEPNGGNALADIKITTISGKTFPLSLKVGKSYTFYNGGVTNIMKDDKQRRTFMANLGADYNKFEEGFGISAADEYSPKIESESIAAKFLGNFISESIGSDYIFVHVNGNDSIVKEITTQPPIKVSIDEYIYPEINKRKYFAINLKLSFLGKTMSGQFQLRNNSGKVFPNVIYIYESGKTLKQSKPEEGN